MTEKSIQILKNLQFPNGLFSASSKLVKTGYNKSWIRDNIYESMGLEKKHIFDAVKTYHAIFDILLKHEGKIDWAIMEKPSQRYQYIHARFCPETMNEFWEDWGNKQNDAIGLFLFKVADLTQKGLNIVRNRHDFRILQKLVHYLESVEYWKDQDNGIWEENEEIHASSVGACVAALSLLKETIFDVPMKKKDFKNLLKDTEKKSFLMKLNIPQILIDKGKRTLNILLPRESITKEVDLSLLSLIYPFNIVNEQQKRLILTNIETKLVRYNGVIRYIGDKYYSNEFGEARWTMGFPWLAIIYHNLGNYSKYHFYMHKSNSVMNINGELPELYYANTNESNENTPLGWSQALYIIAETLDKR